MTYAIRAITVERGLDPREFAALLLRRRRRAVRRGDGRGARDPDGGRPARAGELLGLGHPHVGLPGRRGAHPRARVRRGVDRRARRRPAHARGAGDDRASRVRVRRGRARAPLPYRRALRGAGAHDHRAARDASGSTTSRRCSPGSATASSRCTASCTATARSDAPLEVVTVRCRAVARVGHPRFPEWQGDEPAAPVRSRSVYFRGARRLRRDAGLRPRAGGPRPGDRGPGDRRGVDDDDRRPARAGACAPTALGDLVLENGQSR